MAKKHDVKKVLSDLTGIREQAIGQIMKDVRVNLGKLDSCRRHRFGPHVPLQRRYTCEECGGSVNEQQRRWYQFGLEHAGGRDGIL